MNFYSPTLKDKRNKKTVKATAGMTLEQKLDWIRFEREKENKRINERRERWLMESNMDLEDKLEILLK